MKKATLILITFILSLCSIKSQSIPELDSLSHFPRYTLGYTLSAAMNEYPGYQVSQDLGVTDDFAIISEFAKTKNEASIYTPDYGYRVKLGFQHIYRKKKNAFLTYGVNLIKRKTAEEETILENSALVERNLINSDLKAFEVTHALHYIVAEQFKIEFGYGLGIGVRQDKINQDIYDLERTFDAIEESFWIESHTMLITTIHFNISYCIVY